MTRADKEKRQPRITLTNTAIAKAAKNCPAVALMERKDQIEWLRNALAWGEDADTSKMHADVAGRAIVLPAEFTTDLGDRLVALCIPDEHNSGELVVTTVKPMRALLATKRIEGLRAPLVSAEKRAAFALVPVPAPKPLIPIPPPVVTPVPPPAPVPTPAAKVDASASEDDNRGAQLVRMEIAKRRITQEKAAKSMGMPPSDLSRYVNGVTTPSIKAALAMRDHLGVPIEAWGEAAS